MLAYNTFINAIQKFEPMTAYKELQRMHIDRQGSFPYPIPYKHKPTSSNGITRCICDWINYSGGFAERTNTMGVYVKGEEWTDVLGRKHESKGSYRKSSSTKGSSDIKALYKGKSIFIEVKYKKDIQSDAQKEYADRVRAQGGIYFVAKELEETIKFLKSL